MTDKSGLAGISQWINIRYGLTGDARVGKDHPGVQKIRDQIDEQYKDGRVTQVSDGEMERWAAEFIGPVGEG